MSFIDPEDEVTRALRRALHREADGVRPSPDGLRRIQTRIAEENVHTPSRWRRALPSLAAAAAVIVVAIGGAALLRPQPVAVQPGTGSGTVYVNPPPTPAVQPLPVYFAQKQGETWALVREFEPTTETDPVRRLQAALRLAVAGKAGDPDYTSIWRHLRLTGDVTAEDGTAPVVTLSKALVGRGATSAADDDGTLARLAVQQLVWTATATSGQNVPVTVRSETGAKLFGALTLGGTFERTVGAKDPRAPLWISSLAEGQGLKVGTATVTGDALETGSLTWMLERTDGTKEAVDRGLLTLVGDDGKPTPLGQRGTWTITLKLAERGGYRLTVQAFDTGLRPTNTAKPGTSVADWTDTRTVTVR